MDREEDIEEQDRSPPKISRYTEAQPEEISVPINHSSLSLRVESTEQCSLSFLPFYSSELGTKNGNIQKAEKCKKRILAIKKRIAVLEKQIKLNKNDAEKSMLFPLTEAQQIQIDSICSHTDEESIVIDKFKNPIQVKDLKILKSQNDWLNDKIINFYVDLISERSTRTSNPLPTVYTFSTFFVERFLTDGYKGVRRYTKKIDIFSYDMILIPENIKNIHWCMTIINLKEKTIRYYDSLGGGHDLLLHALTTYLAEESMDKRHVAYDIKEFSLETVKDMPRQENTHDCGVFACMAAEYVTRCQPLNFTQKDIPNLRSKMILEISSGRLL
ncbi:sentrin-specific protease 1-like [Drosophila pseudoobscura]|uniref:Sentrin-specific protease 1-like n=1 Tax=Drosophila pseudoobscura pseudoobscura TaxID=46245 RepID=A0A6I8VNY0_DROPS|nr:sentrin-specific protease 1 [Drosophila pseudoobscura]